MRSRLFIIKQKFWLRTLSFLLLFAAVIDDSNAQEVDNQLWVNYALTVPATNRFSYGGDVGFRGFISNQEWNQVLFRPTATYRFNQEFAVALAVANFTTFNVEDDNVYEFRIHQDFNLNWPNFGFVDFFFRLRTEQRWFFYPTFEDDFNIRVRLLGGLETQDFRLGEGKRPFYFQFIFEACKY